jgi:hypothetical protein
MVFGRFKFAVKPYGNAKDSALMAEKDELGTGYLEGWILKAWRLCCSNPNSRMNYNMFLRYKILAILCELS